MAAAAAASITARDASCAGSRSARLSRLIPTLASLQQTDNQQSFFDHKLIGVDLPLAIGAAKANTLRKPRTMIEVYLIL